jgi:hypothetical protein
MRTSENTDKIIPAYIKAEHEVGAVKKTASNPHFRSKYADLEAVMEACSDALSKNDLAVWQSISDGQLITRLFHSSGQWMEGYTPLIIAKNDMQGLGSAYTYARRYGLMAIMGIAPEDDDGNAATDAVRTEKKAAPKTQNASHVEEAKKILVEANQIDDAKELMWFRNKITDRLKSIQDISEVTYAYVIKSLDDRHHALTAKKEETNA